MSYYEENGRVYYDEIYFNISGENLPDEFFDGTQEIEARLVYNWENTNGKATDSPSPVGKYNDDKLQ